MVSGVEVNSYTLESICLNECVLCKEIPSVGSVSIFVKGLLGTHINVYLCKRHWDDVSILQGISQATQERAHQIEQGVTWKRVAVAS